MLKKNELFETCLTHTQQILMDNEKDEQIINKYCVY